MKPIETAETKAKNLYARANKILGELYKAEIIKELVTLFLKAGERDEVADGFCEADGGLPDNSILTAVFNLSQERNSLREKLEASQIQHRVVLGRLEELQDKALSTNSGQSLLDELKTLRADSEQLVRVRTDGKFIKVEDYNKLLDELKLAKEKAETLDWLEKDGNLKKLYHMDIPLKSMKDETWDILTAYTNLSDKVKGVE